MALVKTSSGSSSGLNESSPRRRSRSRRPHRSVRRRFAQALVKLAHAVKAGEVGPESATFRTLYPLNLALMEWPGTYDEMQNALDRFVVHVNPARQSAGPLSKGHDPYESGSLYEESDEWGELTREAVMATARALGHIDVGYGLMVRYVWQSLRRPAHEDRPETSPPGSPTEAARSQGLEMVFQAPTMKRRLEGAVREARASTFDLMGYGTPTIPE